MSIPRTRPPFVGALAVASVLACLLPACSGDSARARRAHVEAANAHAEALAAAAPEAPPADPLPSWNDTAPKQAIFDYVARVTTEGSKDFVPPDERIAVFDNDGTLWPENPLPFQLLFVLDRLHQMVGQDPQLAQDEFVKAALDGDLAKLMAGEHHDGLMHIIGLTHAGMTTDVYASQVQQWLDTARHPRFGRAFDDLGYQPMLELLAYLRSHGFQTFIVSGGGADFMRVWTDRAYGIPPHQVVGSNTRPEYELTEHGPQLTKTMDAIFVDDKEGKPVGIYQFIGQRPIACFGNSDGDKAMLEYTTIGNPRPSFGLLVHHTDAEREYAYDKETKSSGKLVDALADAPQRGWVVVDMAADWATVFTDAGH